jgi:hypothetical protein
MGGLGRVYQLVGEHRLFAFILPVYSFHLYRLVIYSIVGRRTTCQEPVESIFSTQTCTR